MEELKKVKSSIAFNSVAAAIFMASVTPSWAAPIVYMTGNLNPTTFGTADLAPGSYNLIANTSQQLVGLASTNGALYGAGRGSSTLYQINPTTGALTTVGSAGFTYVDIGSTLTGLYGLDSSGNLYSINAGTGASTLLGSTGAVTNSGDFSLSNGSSTLFFAGNNGNLYTLSTANGVSTLVGFLGAQSCLGNACPDEMSALDFVGGTLYAGIGFPGSNLVFTVNTSTGAATNAAPLSGAPGSADGWAQIVGGGSPSAPEPGTWVLMIIGMGFTPLVLKKARTHVG